MKRPPCPIRASSAAQYFAVSYRIPPQPHKIPLRWVTVIEASSEQEACACLARLHPELSEIRVICESERSVHHD